MGKLPSHRTSLHGERTGMAMKIGCVVYVPLPAVLRPWYQQWRKNLHDKPDVDIPFDDFLMLFMN
jgi:hypothetical protein